MVIALDRIRSRVQLFAQTADDAYNAAQGIRTMSAKPETYLAVYVIFTFLNAIRRGIGRKHIWREFRRQGITLTPRLSFWIALCTQAGLISRRADIKVTSFAKRWLLKTTDEQTFHLIDAWQNAPRNPKVRMFRRKLLWKMKYAKSLTGKDLGALNGLVALGLVTPHVSARSSETGGVAGGQLTKWGEFFIQGKGELPTPRPKEPCTIHQNVFTASIPQHADLLWEIENHLRPNGPGTYPLTKRALYFFQGDPHALIQLIERGLQSEIPGQTKALILHQPSIRIADGTLVEFSSPVELQQLRRQPAFRKYIEEFLSPQRVLVSNQSAKLLFQMLKRRGVYVHRNEEQVDVRKARTHFPSSSKALLQPMDLNVPKLTILEKYKQLQQALDIYYRTPGYPAEKRRITPLLIEQRGEQTYVIAYCQTRRAQRTFRLDRIDIPGTG